MYYIKMFCLSSVSIRKPENRETIERVELLTD